MTIAVAVCITLILAAAALTAAAMRRARRPPAPPCSPADLTVLDLPPLLARRYVQAARQEERP
jgi:hypothetical protein